MSFLTLEDVNTANLDHVNTYYELDTSLISEQEFSDVLYDFNIVSHSISGSNHTFTIEVHNNLWCGNYAVVDSENSIIPAGISFNGTNTITIVTTSESIRLFLYMCSYATSFEFVNCIYFPQSNSFNLPLDEIGTSKTLSLFRVPTDTQSNTFTANEGVSTITVPDVNLNQVNLYMLVNIIKSDVTFNLSDEVTVGIVNQVKLNVASDFLPGGSLIGNEELDIEINYNDETIQAYYDETLNDYCFDLDLTDKINDNNIGLTINFLEGDYTNASSYDVTVTCIYSSASSFTDLQSQITAGAEIIELTNTITFENSITLPNNLYIIADDHTIDIGSYNILIPDSVNFRLSSANVINGKSCFVQADNSKVILENCKFTNASITDINKGSVVTSNYTNTVTEITDCEFYNCHHTIFTGSELTVKNCKARFNIWNESIDTDYAAFLTAYEGNVEITDSVFDIDYVDYASTMMTNQVDIKYAQALIGIGETTSFNGTVGTLLSSNDCLPFTDSQYNNQSHIYAAYYYPEIDDNVVISPTIGKEDKSVCHAIVGTDWVYKNNAQITRYSTGNQNEIRKITWGE